jgi:hypothetical protein
MLALRPLLHSETGSCGSLSGWPRVPCRRPSPRPILVSRKPPLWGFDLRKTPAMRDADLTKVYAIRFANFGAEHANDVWIDEVLLHAGRGF